MYELIYLQPVSGDGTAKYYLNANTTIDGIDGWGMPSRRVSTTDVVSKDGWVKHVAGYEGQNVNIDFFMECQSYSDLWNEKDTLNTFLRCSELKIVRQELGRFMIGTYQSDGWAERADDAGIRVAGRLSFVCADPFKYNNTYTDRTFKGFVESGVAFNHSIYNSGNYHIYPYIYVSGVVGSLSALTITNLENNTRFDIVKDINVGKFLLIDNDEKDVYMSGGISALKYTSPQTDFIKIDPGANRLFFETSDSDSGEFSASFEIGYYDRWL